MSRYSQYNTVAHYAYLLGFQILTFHLTQFSLSNEIFLQFHEGSK
jgi:hypothetical protein